MLEATTTPAGHGIDAGRQTPAHAQLSRALWLRKRGDVFRFLLESGADPELTLERIGAEGATLTARVVAAAANGRGGVDSGLVLVDGRDGLAFCSTAEPTGLLRRLAASARAGIAATPALALLIDSGAGPLTADPADDAAARAYEPPGAEVVYDPVLWDELLEPEVATTAAALAAVLPGERLWFWLAEDETAGDAVPLIVQPVAWDPNHDRTNWLVERNTERGARDGVTGTATVCDDGTIQFLASGFYPQMLEQLAAWVTRRHAEFPALGRLVDFQLLSAAGGSVDRIIADPALWTGVARDAVPATIRATAAVFDALPAGADCWFWITGGPAAPPFLHLVPTADDPDGVAFQAELPRLYKRFAASFGDAIAGVMSRPGPTDVLFSSRDAGAGRFATQVAALLDRYGAEFPALRPLAGASLVQADADGQPRVVATAAAAS